MTQCKYETIDKGADGINSYRCVRCGDRRKSKRPAEQLYRPCGEKAPPLQQQAWNLATSLAAFVADGFKTVDEKQHRERMEICEVCEHRQTNRCLKCGCWITLKVRGRAFRCPESKWPTIVEE